jgi:acetate kinase
MKILVLNAGSSSQKSCLYDLKEELPKSPPTPLWEAKVDWTQHQEFAEITVKTNQGVVLEEELKTDSHSESLTHLWTTLWSGKTQVITQPSEIDIVGHRVVHGGAEYQQPTLINQEVKEAIARLATFAPIHNPANLEGINAIEKLLPNRVQVAVFDTAFHSHIPQAAAVYPLPYEWFEKGIRRYGFHGISHQYCAQRTGEILGRDWQSLRLITCHLGNGCSLAAIQGGKSIDTTMGFTPLEGLMMGTRSGSIDPGILTYWLQQSDNDANKLNQILNYASGLKGISGISGDLRQIMKAIAEGNSRAQLAWEMYIHSLRKHIGAMLATLGGLDAVVFTGGVGENSALVRSQVCAAFEFLGWQLNAEQNAQSPVDQDLATNNSTVRIVVVHTEEDWAIAQECWTLAKQLKQQ